MTRRSEARSQESIEFGRDKHRNSNEFAAKVWQWIRNRQTLNARFRREYPTPPFTVDFCCVKRKLIIEIDGEGHFTEEGLNPASYAINILSCIAFQHLMLANLKLKLDERSAHQSK